VEQTYFRWRKEYGGLQVDQAKRLKELEQENSKLKRLVANLTISGQNLLDAEGHGTVYFSGVSLPILDPSATSLHVKVPAGATSGTFDVNINGVGSNAAVFTVTTVPVPQIASLSANNGADYATITLTGTDFGASQGSSIVTFNGVSTTVIAWSSTGIAVRGPTMQPPATLLSQQAENRATVFHLLWNCRPPVTVERDQGTGSRFAQEVSLSDLQRQDFPA